VGRDLRRLTFEMLGRLTKAARDPELAWLVVDAKVMKRRRDGGATAQLPSVQPDERARVDETLTRHGSDKAAPHTYGETYASILRSIPHGARIVELGIGTNNEDVPCNMGSRGVPGASLRAFRELCPDAELIGADIDRRILFQEDRISTYWVDQLDRSSLRSLRELLGGTHCVDLVIDDGLHSKRSNLNSLRELVPAVKPGGYYVIEDVDSASLQFWRYMLRREHLRGQVLAMPEAAAGGADINNLVVVAA
jgi:hypothetical protein